MWVLRESVDELVVGKISGQVSLGLYTMAKELALMPNHKIANVINMLSSPVMAELQGNIDAMRTALYRAVRLSAAIVVPMSAEIALVADEMVPALLGPKWAPATPVLRLPCFYAVVRAIDALLPPVLFARHRERFLFWYTFVLLAAVLSAAVLGAPWDGAAGVVIFSTPVYCTVMAFMAREALAELNGSLPSFGWRPGRFLPQRRQWLQ
jgi:O-antigen/teichoic acid export membrane protein